MYNKKDFIGMKVRQGSLRHTVPEVIKDIVWEWDDMTKVEFESGLFTLMSDEEFEIFAESGEIEYNVQIQDGFRQETMYRRSLKV